MNNFQYKLYLLILSKDKLFIDFLRQQDILLEFFWRIGKTKSEKTKELINNVSKLKVSKYIKVAFVWENTKEGYLFWENIDKKWLIFLLTKFYKNCSQRKLLENFILSTLN